ncbi:methionine--tRNA ligase [Microgenomates group bacterium RBG_16_45_19]|nr:MAG: methionine--tRNA ligase [Microgenomates group bacterium RBG_16_45_19]
MKNKFFITAAIPYVNAKPHIGHALEFVQTDVLKRYHRLLGEAVLSLSGGDENALKNVQAAEAAGKPIQEFVDTNTESFRQLAVALKTEFEVWQKGSSDQHHRASQELWRRCREKGDIYKQNYTGLYCVGCEAFYAPDELNEQGECREHPGKKLEAVTEENYFFKLSNYQKQLEDIIQRNELEIIPQTRKNEVLAWVKKGLKDISISRTNERAKNWGVPVPDDPTQRIYVWFDALNIYQSGIGFGWDEAQYAKWWPADLQVIGKGIIRFHAVYWPAFLLSAGLPLPKKILVHEYFTVNGQKMSKTLGNVYDPLPLLQKHGADPLRYYCLAKISPFADGDFSEEKFNQAYNSDLANSLGNTVSRVAKLCQQSGLEFAADKPPGLRSQVKDQLTAYRFDYALEEIWKTIKTVEQTVEAKKVWALTGTELNVALTELVAHLRQVGFELQPFLPETSEKILAIFKGPQIVAPEPLFPRIEESSD